MKFCAIEPDWIVLFCVGLLAGNCTAQDLAPRAYLITPIHSNAITLTYSLNDGGILFDGSVPITDATARVNLAVFSYTHALSFFGRTSNFTSSLPYAIGNFQGSIGSTQRSRYRSGLMVSSFRFSVNLKGGPAMDLAEFRQWRQKNLLGVSIRVLPPTGQYDPTKVINFGTNRWAFKPELGYSRRWGHWILDAYGGAWLYTTNPDYLLIGRFASKTNRQSQAPIGSFEGHLSYDLRRRLWISLDGNYWFGGRTSLNGVQNPNTFQKSSRVGVSGSIPLTARQSLKLSYSDGAYVRFGGNFKNVSVAWQYSWLGRPN
jgi:hypothetical protein